MNKRVPIRPHWALAALLFRQRLVALRLLMLILILIWTWNQPVMGVTRLQTKEIVVSAGTSPASGSFGSNVTAGSLIVVLIAQHSASNRPVSSVSDNINGNYTKVTTAGTYGTNPTAEAWYFVNSASGAPLISIAWTNGTDTKDIFALEYSGCVTSSPLDTGFNTTGFDTIVHASSASQQYATNTDTSTANGGVILGTSALNGSNTGYSSTSGMTQIVSTDTNTTFAERITSGSVSTNGSYTLTNARSFTGLLVSFKATAATSGLLLRRQRTLMAS